jgi:hypothetical protein
LCLLLLSVAPSLVEESHSRQRRESISKNRGGTLSREEKTRSLRGSGCAPFWLFFCSYFLCPLRELKFAMFTTRDPREALNLWPQALGPNQPSAIPDPELRHPSTTTLSTPTPTPPPRPTGSATPPHPRNIPNCKPKHNRNGSLRQEMARASWYVDADALRGTEKLTLRCSSANGSVLRCRYVFYVSGERNWCFSRWKWGGDGWG